MAVAAGAVADLAKPAVAAGVEQAKELFNDPILKVSDMLVKVGALMCVGAGFAFAIAQASARQEQAFLNDIQDRLGQPQTNSPTPQKNAVPPPPPLYQTQLQGATAAYNSLSPTNAKANLTALQTMLANAQSIQSLATAQGAPSSVINDLNAWVGAIVGAVVGMEIAYAGAVAVPSNPAAADVGWSQSKVAFVDVALFTNLAAADLGFPMPIPIGSTTAPTIPWWEQPFASIGAAVVGGGAQVVNDVTGLAQDVSAIASDIGSGLAFLTKGLMNLPQLIWDGFGYSTTWAANTIFSDLWPWLLGLGLLFVVIGGVVKWTYTKIWPRLKMRVELNANARLARLWNRFDKWNKSRRKVQEVWTQKSTEGQIASANANPVYIAPVEELPEPKIPAPPSLEAGPAAEAKQTEPEAGGGAAPTAEVAPPPGPATPPEKPLPMGTPTEDVEAHLGEGDVKAPTAEELRAQEAARVASMPPQPAPVINVTVAAPVPKVKVPTVRKKRIEPTSEELFVLAARNC